MAQKAPVSSSRVQLARLAEQVIVLTDRVRPAMDAEGRWLTADGARTISGVTAVEDGLGQIEVELHLDAVWPPEPLDALGEDLRRRLRRSAGMAGLDDRLGALQIFFHDVVMSEDPVVR